MDRGQPERPLREWVRLRPADPDACLAYMREAWSFVDPDAASWPQAASMSRPRVRRTVARTPCSSSAARKAAIASRPEPS